MCLCTSQDRSSNLWGFKQPGLFLAHVKCLMWSMGGEWVGSAGTFHCSSETQGLEGADFDAAGPHAKDESVFDIVPQRLDVLLEVK